MKNFWLEDVPNWQKITVPTFALEGRKGKFVVKDETLLCILMRFNLVYMVTDAKFRSGDHQIQQWMVNVFKRLHSCKRYQQSGTLLQVSEWLCSYIYCHCFNTLLIWTTLNMLATYLEKLFLTTNHLFMTIGPQHELLSIYRTKK